MPTDLSSELRIKQQRALIKEFASVDRLTGKTPKMPPKRGPSACAGREVQGT